MNYHRWSSLFRGYDLALRHNQLILALTAAGTALGFFAGNAGLWPRIAQGLVAGITVFMAGALAKELDPDRPQSAILAAALVLFFVWVAYPFSPIALFWLLGSLRFLNRSTGLAPKTTDSIVLLIIAAWLSWQVTPLFGILMGILLILDTLLPDGQRIHAVIGVMILSGSVIWLFRNGWPAAQVPLWLVGSLLAITMGFIVVILNTYHTAAVGDTTGSPLNPTRIQAAQAFGLIAGLLFASWLGEMGILLLIALWAALLAVLTYHLLFVRPGRTVATH